MKRAKIGDVFFVKVPNGYKLFQWAYDHQRVGRLIRVFDGLYNSVPENIAEIVTGPHSYIMFYDITKAYRIGLAQRIETFPVPENYPMPEYKFSSWNDMHGKVFRIEVVNIDDPWKYQNFDVSSMQELPEEYQNLTMLDGAVSAAWALYLFDTNWNLSELEKYWPEHRVNMQKYQDIIDEFLEKDPLKKRRHS